jgi:anti-sigma B factor antagonist
MTITKSQEAGVLTLVLTGRLDTVTAPELNKEVDAIGSDIKELILDFTAIDYISSAGLRALLCGQKKMTKQGTMKLHHVRVEVQEVLDLTGFSDILTIEK